MNFPKTAATKSEQKQGSDDFTLNPTKFKELTIFLKLHQMI